MVDAFVERYDRTSGLFLPQTDTQVLTWPDLIDSPDSWPPEGSRVYLVATIHDIDQTVIKALCSFGRRYPDSRANVIVYPSALHRVAEAETGAVPIFNATFPPLDTERKKYQQIVLPQVFAAGFAGALLSDDYLDPIEQYPDTEFYRYEPMSSR